MSSKKSSGEPEQPKSDMQERYMKAQMYEQQLKQVQKYLETFDQQLIDIRRLIDSIREFGELKKGDRVMAPLTSGIFVKAVLDDPTELLINVGSDVVVAKSIPDAVKMLEVQEAEINKYRSEALGRLESLMASLGELEEE